ncbi:MAG: HEPN domain-containing protein [Spirochaetia bacterium]|jgi:HEPN domain-containing protein
MRPDSAGPGTPEDWLRHARSHLALAVAVGPVGDVLAETLCYHAQQAAEKALKAVLINVGVEFPRTHSLRLLVDLLPPTLRTKSVLESAVALTDYAVTARYPGEIEPISQLELEESIRIARGVVSWAESKVCGSPSRALPP